MDVLQFSVDREHEESVRKRRLVLLVYAIAYVGVLPYLLFTISVALDRWLKLPGFYMGSINLFLALGFILPGAFLALWSVQLGIQFVIGKGTPSPRVPPKKLIVQGPYRHCRNSMLLGDALAYLGIGIGVGSLSALMLVLLCSSLYAAHLKFTEERKLALRFGQRYLLYSEVRRFSYLVSASDGG